MNGLEPHTDLVLGATALPSKYNYLLGYTFS